MSASPAFLNRISLRTALFTAFFLCGFLFAAWIVRTPAVREALGLSMGAMGWVLFGISAGAFTGLLTTSRIIARVHAALVINGGLLITALGLLISALPLALGLIEIGPWMTAAGLWLLGFGTIFTDIACNVAGAGLEVKEKRPFITTLHGGFSLGEAAGAAFGFGCTAIGLAPFPHFVAATVPAVILILIIWKPLSAADVFTRGHAVRSTDSKPSGVLRFDQLLIIGLLVVFAVALAEGTANDWLPILVSDVLDAGGAFPAFAFAVFAGVLALVRFTGTYWLTRFGASRVLIGSASLALIGILLTVGTDNRFIMMAGIALWSSGAALGYPVALSSAAAAGSGDSQTAAKRMAALSTGGYGAFLVGPPCLGFLADHFGLPAALGAAGAFLLIPILLGGRLAAAPKRRTAGEPLDI